jgi:hypothetical protein
MATTGTVPIGPWPLGIVNAVSDHAIGLDALADARDCDIDREGHVLSRTNYTLLDDSEGYAYPYEHKGTTYAVTGGMVGTLNATGFTGIKTVEGRVGWTEVEGSAVFTDHTGVYRIEGLYANKLVSRTQTEEEERYGLADMVGGHAVSYWNGRLLVLRGLSLIWSEAIDYGVYSPVRNTIRFPSHPTWMAALPAGIFVGMADSVMYLGGSNPLEFTKRQVAGPSSPFGALVADAQYIASDVGGGGLVAIWFGDSGFVVGRGDGSVVYPQAGNLRGIPIVPRNIVLIDERLYAFPTEE